MQAIPMRGQKAQTACNKDLVSIEKHDDLEQVKKSERKIKSGK
jgi:hypothetical protein